MEQTLQQLVSEVETLSMLLKIVLVLLVVLLIIGVKFLRGVAEAHRLTMVAGQRRAFLAEAEEFLRQESYSDLAELSTQRLDGAPGDASGFYYLGRAHFGLNRLAEAKSNFQRAWELDPLSRDELEKCISAVEEELAGNKPKSVD